MRGLGKVRICPLLAAGEVSVQCMRSETGRSRFERGRE